MSSFEFLCRNGQRTNTGTAAWSTRMRDCPAGSTPKQNIRVCCRRKDNSWSIWLGLWVIARVQAAEPQQRIVAEVTARRMWPPYDTSQHSRAVLAWRTSQRSHATSPAGDDGGSDNG